MKNMKNTKHKNAKKKKPFNMYEFMYRKRKVVVGGISALLVLSMIIGLLAQFAYSGF